MSPALLLYLLYSCTIDGIDGIQNFTLRANYLKCHPRHSLKKNSSRCWCHIDRESIICLIVSWSDWSAKYTGVQQRQSKANRRSWHFGRQMSFKAVTMASHVDAMWALSRNAYKSRQRMTCHSIIWHCWGVSNLKSYQFWIALDWVGKKEEGTK